MAVDGASNAYTSSTPVRGDWSAAKPLKKTSQATVSQVACNATLCVEVDNRGTVTYGVVKGSTPTKPRRPPHDHHANADDHQDHDDEDVDPEQHELTRRGCLASTPVERMVTVRPWRTPDNLRA